MRLVKVTNGDGGATGGGADCAGKSCPAVYKTDCDSFVVQGLKLIKDDLKQIELGDNESAVEIPASLIEQIKKIEI